jgi:carbon monoxide dehydrogenase subunit G
MSRKNLTRGLTVLAGAGAAAVAIYVTVGRFWHLRWGAADREADGGMPGDDLIPGARMQSTRAITIHATPEQVWPWLVQIGYGRAGWYSYDALEKAAGAGDFAEGASARAILPEFQGLTIGDSIPLAPGSSFTVVDLQPSRVLALRARINPKTGQTVGFSGADFNGFFDGSWVFRLTPIGEDGARLVVRFRADFAPSLPNTGFAYAALEPAVFIMEQKMLRGIRERAEAIYAA